MSVRRNSGGTISILRKISPGTQVDIWFDRSGFRRTSSQFTARNESAFSGGGFDGGLTYINSNDIRAIRIGAPRG